MFNMELLHFRNLATLFVFFEHIRRRTLISSTTTIQQRHISPKYIPKCQDDQDNEKHKTKSKWEMTIYNAELEGVNN